MVESHPSFMSIFETFIYWAQKYTVTIYLNENTPLQLLRYPETGTLGCMQPLNPTIDNAENTSVPKNRVPNPSRDNNMRVGSVTEIELNDPYLH